MNRYRLHCDNDSLEALGEYYDATWQTRAEAEDAADHLRELLGEWPDWAGTEVTVGPAAGGAS